MQFEYGGAVNSDDHETEVNKGGLPEYIEKQLAEPYQTDTRHDAWRDLSFQMRGEGIPEEVIFERLRLDTG